MLGTGQQLFDHIAECLAELMKVNDSEFSSKSCLTTCNKCILFQEQGICSERLSLGFSFSFEMKQLALEKAVMVKWAKGFDCSDVLGEDVVELLNDAIVRRGVRLNLFN